MLTTRPRLNLVKKTPIRPDDIDNFVSAEIPDKERDPELNNVVMKHMIHGPCGPYNRNSVCMVDGKCSKKFPKIFIRYTEQGVAKIFPSR